MVEAHFSDTSTQSVEDRLKRVILHDLEHGKQGKTRKSDENDEYVRYNVIVIVRLPVLCRLFFCASCMASCLRKKGQASFVIGSFRPLDFGGAIISQPEDAFCIDISQSECYIVNNQLTKRLKDRKSVV